MSKLTFLHKVRLLAAGAAMAFAGLAQAQYMWVDEKGLKQFSDRAPPSSVPLKNILKAPRGVATADSLPAEQPAAGAPEAAKAKPAPTLAERNADFNKRAKEKGEREQKEKAEEDAKAAKSGNCERAQRDKQTLDSGTRIATRDSKGERSFMSDEQRAAESARIGKVLAECK